jgi:hypothetical protein
LTREFNRSLDRSRRYGIHESTRYRLIGTQGSKGLASQNSLAVVDVCSTALVPCRWLPFATVAYMQHATAATTAQKPRKQCAASAACLWGHTLLHMGVAAHGGLVSLELLP